MALSLALLEGGVLFATVSATILVGARPLLTNWIDLSVVLGQALALSLCYVVACYYNSLYDFRKVTSFVQFASRLPQSLGTALILVAALYALFPKAKIEGAAFISSLLTMIGLLTLLRALCYRAMRSRPMCERVLIVGTGLLAQRLIEEIELQIHCRYAIIGVVDDATASGEVPSRYPLLGPLNTLGKIIEEARPGRIIVALAERRGRLPVHQLIEPHARGIAVEDGVEVYERLTGKLAIESLVPSHLIFSKDFRTSRLELAAARAVNLAAAVAGLIALAPILVLIALAIKLDSHGPVLHILDRVGLGGKRFKLIKFRTMHPVEGETSVWFQDNHHRITRVGKWLRKFRLDELPQFVNILRGDMNFVGPRPHRVSKFELFAQKIPYFSLRSVVRPGLTGWAQVRHGYASDLEEETEKIRYDLYYIKHRSLWLDLRIIFDTVKIVLLGRGSAVASARRAAARENQPERLKTTV